MPARTTPTKASTRRAKSKDRKSVGRKSKVESDDDAPGTPIVTSVSNMRLRSGTKLSRKKYSYNHEEGEGSDVEPAVIAKEWPAATPAETRTSTRRARWAAPTPTPPPSPPRALSSSQNKNSSRLSMLGTVVLICAVFIHWIYADRTMNPSASGHTRADVNSDREQVLSAVLRQQDNAIQHWRSQQNLMWPVVVDLEKKLKVLGQKIGYESKAVVQPFHPLVALDCVGRECTDQELEIALEHLLSQTSIIARKIQNMGVSSAIIEHVVGSEGGAAPPPVREEREISSQYCARMGKHIDSGALTMKDELLCRGEYVMEATARLSESHTAMKTQFLQRITEQEIRLQAIAAETQATVDRHAALQQSTAPTRHLADKQSLNFKDLIEESMKANLAAGAPVVETKLMPRMQAQLEGVLDSMAHDVFNEFLVGKANITDLMSAASDAKSRVVGDLQHVQSIVARPPAAETETAVSSYITEVDVVDYVNEIISKRKKSLIKDVEDKLSLVVSSVPQDIEPPTHPAGVFEYSSRMRGGKVYVKPLVNRFVDSATAIALKTTETLFGKEKQTDLAREKSTWSDEWLTTEPFAVTGSRAAESATPNKLISTSALGSPLWAKNVLNMALGWDAEHSGSDAQVILNHLYPTELDDEDTVSAPIVAPGNCYAFASHEGNMTVSFKTAVRLHSIALYHPSAFLLPPPVPADVYDREWAGADDATSLGGVSSAPQSFSVFGWRHKNALSRDREDGSGFSSQIPVFLGKYTYNAVDTTSSRDELQEFVFDFQSCPDCAQSMSAVTVAFHSNHGNPLFTCVYRVKIFGRAE